MIELRISALKSGRKVTHGTSTYESSLATGTKMEHYGELFGLALNAVRNQITPTKKHRDLNAFMEALKSQLDAKHFDGLDGPIDFSIEDAAEVDVEDQELVSSS